MRRLTVLVLLLSSVACQRASRTPPPEPVPAAAPTSPPLTTVPVTGGISMITGDGGNIGVSVGEDGVLLIDDKFEPLAEGIKAELARLSPQPVKFLINTHWHGDHTGGNPVFGRDSVIVAHDNVRARLSTTQQRRGKEVPPLPKEGLPVVTFAQSVSLHFNGEEIQIIHLPHGHTDGDAVVYFTRSKVVHMGDHLFTGRFPFIDVSSGGNVAHYTENVARVIALIPDDAKVIPGHGELATKADLVAFHHMLVETRRIVEERLAKGQSLAAIQKQGLGPSWKPWAWSFIDEPTWISTIAGSLPGGPSH